MRHAGLKRQSDAQGQEPARVGHSGPLAPAVTADDQHRHLAEGRCRRRWIERPVSRSERGRHARELRWRRSTSIGGTTCNAQAGWSAAALRIRSDKCVVRDDRSTARREVVSRAPSMKRSSRADRRGRPTPARQPIADSRRFHRKMRKVGQDQLEPPPGDRREQVALVDLEAARIERLAAVGRSPRPRPARRRRRKGSRPSAPAAASTTPLPQPTSSTRAPLNPLGMAAQHLDAEAARVMARPECRFLRGNDQWASRTTPIAPGA